MDWFIIFFFVLQITIYLMYLIFVNYATNGTLVSSNPALGEDALVLFGSKWASDSNYTLYIHMALFSFVALALWITLPRRATWSAMGFNLLVRERSCTSVITDVHVSCVCICVRLYVTKYHFYITAAISFSVSSHEKAF